MVRHLAIALLLLPAAAWAEGDELSPDPAQILRGQPYSGDAAPSQIRFVNVRSRPVSVMWIAFDGKERTYFSLLPGQEIVQPTFVAHRWLVKDALDGTPLQAFISTRSAARDNGAAQIALVR